MYTPAEFSMSDPRTLADFIEANSFATLVSYDGGFPKATHLPLLLDRDTGDRGQLVGHMARANPQWKSIDSQNVLAVFHGPHAYISSSWYETDQAVPTWNYVVAHVHGTCNIVDDRDSVLEIVRQYMDVYERQHQQANRTRPASEDYIQNILSATVGFRIAIDRIEGTWKLSQNHDPARRENVVRRLRELGGDQRNQVAELMSETLKKSGDA
ncbi:FMN-binding negative transcriptional regulator [Planctomycetota bacterium]